MPWDKFPKMKRDKLLGKWEPKKWITWYETALLLHLSGLSALQISRKTERSLASVKRVIASKTFQDRANDIMRVRGENVVDIIKYMNENKVKVLQNLVEKIFKDKGVSETQKIDISKWFLEKFPEFKPNQGPTQQTNIIQMTKEDVVKQEKVVEDLHKIKDILAKGNPNVVNITVREETENDTNDRPSSDASNG